MTEENNSQMNIHTYVGQMAAYLQTIDLRILPGWDGDLPYTLGPLAQGEYNMNFLLTQASRHYVVRANTGSQIGKSLAGQIRYEFETLKMLEASGVTPIPYFCDSTCTSIPLGVIIMEHLEGERLDYRTDNQAAARLFARYHQIKPSDPKHLIIEDSPLSLNYERCLLMAPYYWQSPLADPEVADFLHEIFLWADAERKKETYFQQDPWHCIINTEVNNGNFIKNAQKHTLHLVDWEKPLWGDPSQDISHYSVPTTTLWKTNYELSAQDRQQMMVAYKAEIHDPHLRDTIDERVHLRNPFNCLRGVSWCAMAWVKYQTGAHLLKNEDTWHKLSMYVSMDFLRRLFDPWMKKT